MFLKCMFEPPRFQVRPDRVRPTNSLEGVCASVGSFRKISIWVQGGGPNVSEAIHGQASSYKGIVRKFGTPQSAWMRHPIEVKEPQGPRRSLRLY